MGSFKVSCALSNQIISQGDEVVMLMLTRRNSSRTLTCYNWDAYSPIPMLLEGKYNGYGSLENISLFNAHHPKAKVSEQTVVLMNEKLFEELNKQLAFEEQSKAKNLDDIFAARDFCFVRKSSQLAQLDMLIQTVSMLKVSHPDKNYEDQFKSIFSALGVTSLDDLKQKAETLRNQPAQKTEIPIQLVMMKKQALMLVLNTFGKEDNNINNEDESDDNYCVKLQKDRALTISLKKHSETIAFVEGTKDYAGQNHPMFNLGTIYETLKSERTENSNIKIKEVEEFYVRQVLDFSLLNEYMSVLGKTWQPSMTLSDDIAHYGHQDAYAVQQQLLATDFTAKKKPKSIK